MSQEVTSSKSDIQASIDTGNGSVKTSPGRTLFRFISGKGHLLNSLTLTSLILVGMVITFSIISPHFLSRANIFNILEQNVVFGIMACGMAFMIITGGFDLSVGSTAALTGVVVAFILKRYPDALLIAALAGLSVGALAGLCNGMLIPARPLKVSGPAAYVLSRCLFRCRVQRRVRPASCQTVNSPPWIRWKESRRRILIRRHYPPWP